MHNAVRNTESEFFRNAALTLELKPLPKVAHGASF